MLNTIDPTLSSYIDVTSFIWYIGGLCYFDAMGNNSFVVFGAVAVGVGFLIQA